ncbi:hypothetical protein DPX16_22996 [Anabarilius grahami]|uniref:CCHC-type domain-containing protein n=1 Tax=Anabarilius grahami TaxID=495550 RepID=A0A3N0XJ34_ANAGA|nr:hypothetical protein DPX16_22996 [Anabarilius grahami]
MSAPDPFQDLVDALRHTLSSTPTTTPPAHTSAFPAASPSPPAVASPMAKPAPFSGSAEDCNGFLLQCSLVLEMQSHLYPTDSSKVAFIISQLERQRRLTQNLCLYCGQAGHYIAECSTRPARPMVSVILPTLNKMKPLTIVVNLTAAVLCLPVNALFDSGSAGNFISGALCRQLQLKTTAMPKTYQIHSVTGRPLRQVRYSVCPIQLQIGILHMEEIHLLVLEDSTADVILGRPWLEQHNPIIS